VARRFTTLRAMAEDNISQLSNKFKHNTLTFTGTFYTHFLKPYFTLKVVRKYTSHILMICKQSFSELISTNSVDLTHLD